MLQQNIGLFSYQIFTIPEIDPARAGSISDLMWRKNAGIDN
jgi:hypothetical protein